MSSALISRHGFDLSLRTIHAKRNAKLNVKESVLFYPCALWFGGITENTTLTIRWRARVLTNRSVGGNWPFRFRSTWMIETEVVEPARLFTMVKCFKTIQTATTTNHMLYSLTLRAPQQTLVILNTLPTSSRGHSHKFIRNTNNSNPLRFYCAALFTMLG